MDENRDLQEQLETSLTALKRSRERESSAAAAMGGQVAWVCVTDNAVPAPTHRLCDSPHSVLLWLVYQDATISQLKHALQSSYADMGRYSLRVNWVAGMVRARVCLCVPCAAADACMCDLTTRWKSRFEETFAELSSERAAHQRSRSALVELEHFRKVHNTTAQLVTLSLSHWTRLYYASLIVPSRL